MWGASWGRSRWAIAAAAGLACATGLIARATSVAAPTPGDSGPAPELEHVLGRPGASLRAAVDAMAAGEQWLAEALLSAISERHSIIADYADLLRLRLRVEAGRYEDAVALRRAWIHAGSPIRANFYARLGDAYAALGDEARARSTWEYAALATRRSELLVELHMSIAESYRRHGRTEQAAGEYLEVWRRYPVTPGAETSEAMLDELERELGHEVRTASDWRRRADALYRARRNEEALAAYDHALGLGLGRREGQRAREARAETLFRLRRYTEAASAFEALPATEERRIQWARALARSGRVEDGTRALERMGAQSRTRQGTRAVLLAALLRDGEEQPEPARVLYARVIERAPDSSQARVARWRIGWSAYREGRFDEAIEQFEALELGDEDPVSALRPRYWRIRAREQQGEGGTREEYTQLASEFPLSYYGWRARRRADANGAERVLAELRPGTAVLAPRELERPRILIEAGLYDEARQELDRLARRARGMDDRLALAQLYANAGDFYRPQRLVVDAYLETLARGPVPGRLELWWYAWPAPFGEEMRGATLEGLKIDPRLVYSVMREESGYRPRVVSVSGARGLLQLMPATAQRVAKESQLSDFSVDDLFEPRVNIQLGSDYLTSLMRRFEGRESAAIGSYNAGPHVVARWVSEKPLEDDVWVEEIPYDQTRSYVKRVLRSLHAYRVLY